MGRVLVIEFGEQDNFVYEQIMRALKLHPVFDRLRVSSESISDAVLELPGLEIYPDRRKVFQDKREVGLTVKEYDILCLLAANKGIVLSYKHIYETVWGEKELGNESNAVGRQVRKLRKSYIRNHLNPRSPSVVSAILAIA